MALKLEFKDELPFSAATVLEKMLDPKFIEEWTVVQRGLNPKVTLKDRNDKKAVMLIDLEEPLPVGTVKAHMTFNWDLVNSMSTWTRTAEGLAAKSKVWGNTKIAPQGEGKCLFTDEINVDIPIPLVGRKMEETVLKYLKEGRAEKMAFLRRKLGG
ncbi:MAG: DUF2505 family protein [Myxococcales bacterium]|nr:MAG: DUF2505 family protein [Myxococcales bacterium]